MSADMPLKIAVTVAEMARMVGLSRARFYQLMKQAVFPAPKQNPSTKRPFYDQELQQVCLEVRRRNQGINGQVVLFYSRRQEIAPTRSQTKKSKAVPKEKNELVESLRSLGLTVTAAEVDQAMKEKFPGGASGKDEGEVIRAIFLHLKRRNTKDNVGR
jgi:predicted DNA-binding transcriptional regulator AlpA